ncbi:MAG TPA: phosphopentomutase [Saprospiraceae bacterium]|nr:phosphopentomutase [Saprospiraceae bacterium]
MQTKSNRVILIVLDSVGIGYLPDAHLYGDEGSNTLGHIVEKYPALHIPNMISLGLGNIDLNNLLPKVQNPLASYGKAMEQSAGKDTTTGHWEIAGTILEKPFPTFLDGFPTSFMADFEAAIGSKTIGNYAASGTAIIDDLGDEHVRTGFPIVYTSADSVFQIAMHESVIPIEKQYEICQIARDMLTGDYEVGRVIARPFVGTSGQYTRTSRRKDFATMPPDNVLDAINKQGKEVLGIGKIYDIFAGKGITRSIKTANNQEGIEATISAIENDEASLIFTNLVDFDMHFGHRRDVVGYAKCLEEFDAKLPEIMSKMKKEDILIITADHGNDPTWTGTDHTREYIPILIYGQNVPKAYSFGVRNSFVDIAATVSEALGMDFETTGSSCLL